MDLKKIEDGVKLILEGIGEDLQREGLQDTPTRVAKMYAETCSGFGRDPSEVLEVTYGEEHDEMILLKNISLYSTCEHHLLPFHGVAHVAYIPGPSGRVVGLSKIARLVEICARRLQLQERLTTTIADSIVSALDPQGVFVLVEAEHMCMSMRGVTKPGVTTTTSAVRGVFRDNDATRAEAMSIISGK